MELFINHTITYFINIEYLFLLAETSLLCLPLIVIFRRILNNTYRKNQKLIRYYSSNYVEVSKLFNGFDTYSCSHTKGT